MFWPIEILFICVWKLENMGFWILRQVSKNINHWSQTFCFVHYLPSRCYSKRASDYLCRCSCPEVLVKQERFEKHGIWLRDRRSYGCLVTGSCSGTRKRLQVSCGSLLSTWLSCCSDHVVFYVLGAGRVMRWWRCSLLTGTLRHVGITLIPSDVLCICLNQNL